MLPHVITTIHLFKYDSPRPPLKCDAPTICKWLMSWVLNRVRDKLIVIPTVWAIWHATWYVNDSYMFLSIRYTSWYVDRVRNLLTEFVTLRCLQMWLILTVFAIWHVTWYVNNLNTVRVLDRVCDTLIKFVICWQRVREVEMTLNTECLGNLTRNVTHSPTRAY